jgi:ankyrin repeat protein
MDQSLSVDPDDEPGICLDALIQAVKTTDVPQLKRLLEHGADVNTVEPKSGNSLLHLAVLHGGYNAAVHLLNRGCSTAHCNNQGRGVYIEKYPPSSQDVGWMIC